MATDKSVLDLPVVTNISDDDYVFSIVSSQATRLKWSTLTNIVNAWEGISDKPFDTYDDKYFTTNINTDGATQLTLTTDVYQHIHDHLNMDLINKLNIYNDELYYGNQQIMLDLTYDTLRGKPYDNMSDDFTIADITVDDVITKQLQLSQSVTDRLHTHENKSVIDLFSESDSKLFWNGTAVGSDYELPVATTDTIGGVKPDGTTITIDTDGTIHGASQGLDFDALSTAMTTGTQNGITVTADTENSRFNFEVTGMSTIAIDAEGYWTIDGERGENPTKAKGEKGNDGISPTANVTKTETGATITITDSTETTSVDINNGIDGISPHIDETTKHWYIGENDTGVTAEGKVEINTDCVVLYATLLADGWSDTAPYTQTVAVTSISADNVAIVDISLSDDNSLWEAEETAYSNLTKVETADGSITAICLKSKPASDFTIKMKIAGDISGINVVTQSEFDELKSLVVSANNVLASVTGVIE